MLRVEGFAEKQLGQGSVREDQCLRTRVLQLIVS